jgi:hypothetical protein
MYSYALHDIHKEWAHRNKSIIGIITKIQVVLDRTLEGYFCIAQTSYKSHVNVMVKLSRYMPWRHMVGEEV